MKIRQILALTLTFLMLVASVPAALAGSATKHQDMAHARDIVDTAVEAGSFNTLMTLMTAAKAAGLVETLKGKGPFTVFAPTDKAFAKLPAGTVEALLQDRQKLTAILTYHVAPGKLAARDVVKRASVKTVFGQMLPIHMKGDHVMLGKAKVVQADIHTSNGVIHVIDTVLMPKDIVGLASDVDAFTTLVAAVKAAGLVETLQGDGPFTVFAPTNEAFAKLPEGTVETLLKPENRDQLQSILTYHVVPGKVMAADVVKLDAAKTVQGQSVHIHVQGENVMVDKAHVIQTDIIGTNGVIHVIDTVLLPE